MDNRKFGIGSIVGWGDRSEGSRKGQETNGSRHRLEESCCVLLNSNFSNIDRVMDGLNRTTRLISQTSLSLSRLGKRSIGISERTGYERSVQPTKLNA